MKKITLSIICILLISSLVYLWYTRASIYWKLGDLPIYAPKDYTNYSLGEHSDMSLTYVAIGDSLTAGVGVDTYTQSYPYLIARDIARDQHANVQLIPFAIPGIRSEYVVGYFLEPVIATKPDIVTLFIGINDIHGNVSLQKFTERYDAILTTLTQKTTAKVYVINLPPIGTKDLIAQPYRLYFGWKTEQYNASIKDLALKYDVTYVDLASSHQPYALDNAYYARDFFHPNALGYTLWEQTIYANFHR